MRPLKTKSPPYLLPETPLPDFVLSVPNPLLKEINCNITEYIHNDSTWSAWCGYDDGHVSRAAADVVGRAIVAVAAAAAAGRDGGSGHVVQLQLVELVRQGDHFLVAVLGSKK